MLRCYQVAKDHWPKLCYADIVKLFLHFKGHDENGFAMATGWLIRNDVVVTAGHCSFDHNHNLDQLVSIRAYMEYKGRESTDDPKFQVQLRYGKAVATSPDWVEQRVDEAKDVSFILLDHPFTGVKPFVFQTTPEKGWYTLGIVGYPGNLENPLWSRKASDSSWVGLKTRRESLPFQLSRATRSAPTSARPPSAR